MYIIKESERELGSGQKGEQDWGKPHTHTHKHKQTHTHTHTHTHAYARAHTSERGRERDLYIYNTYTISGRERKSARKKRQNQIGKKIGDFSRIHHGPDRVKYA